MFSSTINLNTNTLKSILAAVGAAGILFWAPGLASAASLFVSPATGVYQSGHTFTVQILVNSSGAAINAADGTLSFNPRELQVVSVSRGSSIFSLWTAEPSFSNSAGTISWSGGSPNGYTGSAGNVMTATFRTLTSGAAKISITKGSVLAADGRGTNVLTAMNGGTYTISAVESQPEPEMIVEYVAPANTPAAPVVTSKTHSDPAGWYTNKTAELAWSLPAGITGVRTLLDKSPSTIPTKVYEDPISSITLDDLEEGVSYFHIQFRNSEGWGRVTHVRLAIDTTDPADFKAGLPEAADLTNPTQAISLSGIDDNGAPVASFSVQIDGQEPFLTELKDGEDQLVLNDLKPGHHTIVIEARDAAGNTAIDSLSFTILAFDKPTFTDYPADLNAGVIPVIKGATRPESTVEITLASGFAEPAVYTVNSNEAGEFIFIPDQALAVGVYKLTAIAIDQAGARSEPSDVVTIAVQEPGYIVIGAAIVNVLSLLVTLLALLFLAVAVCWYGWRRVKTIRGLVEKESGEAGVVLALEFKQLQDLLAKETDSLARSRKTGKLTKGESHLIEVMTAGLESARRKVAKEVQDVSDIVVNDK